MCKIDLPSNVRDFDLLETIEALTAAANKLDFMMNDIRNALYLQDQVITALWYIYNHTSDIPAHDIENLIDSLKDWEHRRNNDRSAQ